MINIILNILLVVVFRLDVKGVGIATVISQTVSAILIIRCLAKSNGDIKLELKKLRFSRGKIGAILRIGLPAGLQGSIFSLSNVVIQSSVNIFGPVVVKGNSAAQNLEGFVYFSMNAFHHATLSFTSQNMGAKKYDRLGKILKNGLCLAILFGAGFGGTVILFGRNLLSIYTNDGAAISAGMTRLYIITGTYTLCGIMDVMVGAIRGIGYTVLPTIVSLIGACALRLVWLATVFRIPKFHTINTVYLSYPITWLVTIIAHVICYIIMKYFYYTRHGQTIWNVENKICGVSDVSLTEKGINQAKELGNKILDENIHIDEILYSPLVRAKETALYISEITGIPAKEEPRLKEQAFGKYEGTPRNGADFRVSKRNFIDSYDGGETMLHLAQRIYNLIDDIKNEPGDKVYLLVAHNGISRVVNSYFHDMSNEEYADFGIRNCEIRKYEF